MVAPISVHATSQPASTEGTIAPRAAGYQFGWGEVSSPCGIPGSVIEQQQGERSRRWLSTLFMPAKTVIDGDRYAARNRDGNCQAQSVRVVLRKHRRGRYLALSSGTIQWQSANPQPQAIPSLRRNAGRRRG
jgi:hypothetical protein